MTDSGTPCAGKDRPLTVHHLNELLLVCSLVLLVAVAAVRLSSRSGLPSLLIYLGIGVAIGQDGLGDVDFDNAELTQVLGYAALVVILAEGGLGTKWKEIKPALPGRRRAVDGRRRGERRGHRGRRRTTWSGSTGGRR